MLGARIIQHGGSKNQDTSSSLSHGLGNPDSGLSRALLALQLLLFVAACALGAPNTAGAPTTYLYVCVVLLGHSLLRRAIFAILACRVSIQLLMFIVLVGALCLRRLQEAAIVSLLVCGSDWLLGRVNSAVERALNASFIGAATHATRLDPNTSSQANVPIAELQPGDFVLLRSGEVVPVDGIVRKGADLKVDESPVTGEAMPVMKSPESRVSSGTVVTGGTGEIECTAAVENSFQGRMKAAVDDARSKRSPTEELVDRIARWYTPSIIVASAGVALFKGEVLWGLAVLVSACPCALVAAAPIAQSCTLIRLLTDLQVLVKDTWSLEAFAQLKKIAVDKTGTLTEGAFKLVDQTILPGARGTSVDELKRMLAAVESRDPHPLATCLVAEYIGCTTAYAYGTSSTRALPAVDKFTRVESLGVWGMVENCVVGAGNAKFLDAMGVDLPQEAVDVVRAWEAAGSAFTTVYMTLDDEVAMVMRLEDAVRQDAAQAMGVLQELGIEPALLTGDTQRPAVLVAQQVGIKTVLAGLKPQGKEAWIRNCRGEEDDSNQTYQLDEENDSKQARLLKPAPETILVGMLGDGLNDGPALAAADVGIAISTGLQLTVDAANVVVNKGPDLLLRFTEAVRAARHCQRLVRENILLVVAIKATAVALAATGHLSLSYGVLVDTGSFLMVVFNSLRPLRWSFETADGKRVGTSQ